MNKTRVNVNLYLKAIVYEKSYYNFYLVADHYKRLSLIAANRYYLLSDSAYFWMNPEYYEHQHSLDWLNQKARWDGAWYLSTAANGYVYDGPEIQSNVVFFPLYPFLIWLFGLIVVNQMLSAWIVSSLALLLALIFFYKLLKEFHPQLNPYLPIILILIFPTALFFNAIYTESLFLFLSIATFYYTFQKKYKIAGVFGLLASLTRITGILLFIPMLWEYLKANDFKSKKIISTKILPIFLIPLGTFSFFLFHYLKFGDFLLFFKIESIWGRAFKFNSDHFIFHSYPAIINFLFDLSFVILAIAAIVYVYKKTRVSYALYMAATLAVVLSTGTLMSVGRYILVLFPIFIFAAAIKNDYFRYTWIFGSILVLSMYITLFVNWYWAG